MKWEILVRATGAELPITFDVTHTEQPSLQVMWNEILLQTLNPFFLAQSVSSSASRKWGAPRFHEIFPCVW